MTTKPTCSGGRVAISNSTPKVACSQPIKSPRYAWSAHSLSKRGSRGRSWASNRRPPCCSDHAAGATTTPSKRPSVSTSANRFRPTTFLASIEAALPAALRRLGRLTVDDAGAGLGIPPDPLAISSAQGRVDPHPSTVQQPQIVVVPHAAPVRKLVGQVAPLAACPQQVEHGIHDLAQVQGARTPPPRALGEPRLHQRPLLIGEIRWIRPPRARIRHLILHLLSPAGRMAHDQCPLRLLVRSDFKRALTRERLVAVAAAFRPGPSLTTPLAATRLALKSLAGRYQQLNAEIATLDGQLSQLVATAAPALLAVKGVGPETAGALLVAAGDNPDRLRSEGAFARLCGVAPLPASSGRTTRHRLNRGGDRDANRALYLLVLGRMSWDPRTRDYVTRRTAEGLSKPEIIRCLKRYLAREVYRLLRAPTDVRTPLDNL